MVFVVTVWRLQAMKAKKSLRKHLFVDPKVQGSLITRVALYWIMCLATLTLMILCWRVVTGPARMFYTHFDDMWFHFGPALIGSFLLLPLVIFDIVRLSNRFVGPLIRLRRAMKALARGEEVAPLEFREGDFWKDFAREFNAVAERMHKLNRNASYDYYEEEDENAEKELVGTYDS
jgi:hypothetical protein